MKVIDFDMCTLLPIEETLAFRGGYLTEQFRELWNRAAGSEDPTSKTGLVEPNPQELW
jgi:hypothetical protein